MVKKGNVKLVTFGLFYFTTSTINFLTFEKKTRYTLCHTFLWCVFSQKEAKKCKPEFDFFLEYAQNLL